MPYTFAEVNDITGFANGDLFTNEDEVRNYFTMKTMKQMSLLWGEFPYTQEMLDEMAEAVIRNKWYMV